jgi:microcystin-dependent protein
MAVPYIFSNVPGGSSIPLAELDSNFAYLAGSPTLTSLSISNGLTVGGASSFTGLVTMAGGLNLTGPFTLNGQTVTPTGVTGTGLLVFNTGPTLVSPILGTPASGNLTNCTGYPISQVVGLATGILPFLTNPTTSNLAAAVVDETGTGNLVLSNGPTLTSPIFTSPVLGIPISGSLTNCTGYQAPNLTGVVAVINGGTGMTTTGGVGDVLTVSAPGVLSYAPAAPSSSVAGGAASQILYQTAPNTTGFIPNGSVGQVLLSNGAATPSWGAVNLTTQAAGVLPVANGGTGLTALGTGVQTALSAPIDTVGGLVSYPGGAPAGAVMFFAMPTAPTGWLFCNGAAVSRTTYATLFAAIGTVFGIGDGSTTFNLPNLNGQFIRGWDSSGAVDPGRTFGSNQTASFASHTHTANLTDPGHAHTIQNFGGGGAAPGAHVAAYTGGTAYPLATTDSALTGITVTNSSTGGSETRPVNVALYPCIKF